MASPSPSSPAVGTKRGREAPVVSNTDRVLEKWLALGEGETGWPQGKTLKADVHALSRRAELKGASLGNVIFFDEKTEGHQAFVEGSRAGFVIGGKVYTKCVDASMCELTKHAADVAHTHEKLQSSFATRCFLCQSDAKKNNSTFIHHHGIELTNTNRMSMSVVCPDCRPLVAERCVCTSHAKCSLCLAVPAAAWVGAPREMECREHKDAYEARSKKIGFRWKQESYSLVDVVEHSPAGVCYGIVKETKGLEDDKHHVYALACTDDGCVEEGEHAHAHHRLGFDHGCVCRAKTKPHYGVVAATDLRDGLYNKSVFCDECKPEGAVNVVHALCRHPRHFEGVPPGERDRETLPQASSSKRFPVKTGDDTTEEMLLCRRCATEDGVDGMTSGTCSVDGCKADARFALVSLAVTHALQRCETIAVLGVPVTQRHQRVAFFGPLLKPTHCKDHAVEEAGTPVPAGRWCCPFVNEDGTLCSAEVRHGSKADSCIAHAVQLGLRGVKEEVVCTFFTKKLEEAFGPATIVERDQPLYEASTAHGVRFPAREEDDVNDANCSRKRAQRPDLLMVWPELGFAVLIECDEWGHSTYCPVEGAEELRLAKLARQLRQKHSFQLRVFSLCVVPEGDEWWLTPKRIWNPHLTATGAKSLLASFKVGLQKIKDAAAVQATEGEGATVMLFANANAHGKEAAFRYAQRRDGDRVRDGALDLSRILT